MVATSQAVATRANEADTDYDAYQTVVQIMSKAMSDSILDSLRQLKDPQTFTAHVRDAATAQGIDPDAVRESEELFNRFWTLANGVDLDLSWKSSSGVPVRSAVIADSLEPTQPPVSRSNGQARFSIGVSAFGVGIGVSW
ncbi:hypothetical protein GCM10023335_75390 [Streptomyces siamensis]|uniref:Uncharacterized protein n=2 Tax=Streptomyces siamensis TaxID=1274986 RepID=A0ABP9JHV5_9ACTN